MQGRLVFVSLLLGVLFAAGCAKVEYADVADARVGGASRDTGNAIVARAGALAAAGPVDRYVQMAGSKTTLGQAFVQNTPDVWGPFDVSIRTGFFDPEQKALPEDVRVCLEIDQVGFAVFYLVCGLYDDTLDVWQAFAGTQGGTLPGSINIAGDEIELRVEQTGGNVNFYARAAGAPAWTSVSTTTFPAQTIPLKASFGASALTKGTAVGFDGLQATFSAPPIAPTGAVAVAADVNAALIAAYEAQLDLDAGADDFAAAAAQLDAAENALDDAQVGVAALPASKTNQSAAKHIAKADKGLAKAQDQVADQAAAKAIKTLEKLGRSLVEAALLLNPQPFPAPPI